MLRLVARGMANKDIATSLFISENTVKNHVRNVLESAAALPDGGRGLRGPGEDPRPVVTAAHPALGPDALLDGETVDGADLTGTRAGNARLMECTFTSCVLDDVSLRRSRLVDCSFTAVRSTALDLADAELLDVAWDGCRLGAVQAFGAS